MLKIYTIGGYSHVGRNMTLIQYNDEAIVLDMGLDLEEYISFTQDEPFKKVSSLDLMNVGALPNTEPFKSLIPKVKAIVPSHAHLDHIGAIPFLAKRFKNAKIICTKFTAAVIKKLYSNEKLKQKNQIITVSNNASYKVSNNIKVDFINVTHSVPDSVILVVTTPEGKIVYTNDFKFDPTPILTKATNFEKLKKFSNAKYLIMDSLYGNHPGKSPSETHAKEMLEQLMTQRQFINKAMLITTFSSHIARLYTIVNIAKKIHRTPVFLGRSLSNYIEAAISTNIVKFNNLKFFKTYKEIVKELKTIELTGPSNYLMITTGHQGEPNAVLSKIVDRHLFTFRPHDAVIFSSSTIPQPVNLKNKKVLLDKLYNLNLDVYDDVHVSGHAFNEDHKEMISIVKPEILIPSHCEPFKIDAIAEIAKNYKFIKKVIKTKEGNVIENSAN